MRDFPPLVADLEANPHPRSPRTTAAGTYARAPARHLRRPRHPQPGPVPGLAAGPAAAGAVRVGSVTAVLEWLPGAIGPYVIGRIVDEGIIARDLGRVGELGLVLFGLVLVGVTAGVLNHTLVVRSWLIGMYGPMMLVNRKSVQLGHVLPQRTPTGEVLSVAAGDADEFGALTEIVRPGVRRAGRRTWSSPAWCCPPRCRSGSMVLVAAPLIVVLRPAAAAPAAAPRGGRADPLGRPDLDGDRHRGRAADPARHRRRADLRPQLRRPVAADPAGRGRGRRLAGAGRVGQRAVLRAVPGGAHLAGRPRGGRPAG